MRRLIQLSLLSLLFLQTSAGRAISPALLKASDDFTAVASKDEAWVVNISSAQIVQEAVSPFAMDPFFRQYFNVPVPGQQRVRQSLGSGLVLTPGGQILTNAHVVANADEVTVSLLSGEEYQAKILGWDESVDLAVLKINPKEALNPAVLGDSDKVRVGEWAIAIGNPLGFEHSVTVGVISAKGRHNVFGSQGGSQYQNFLQTDASINPGNSGGPLCNIKGEVIGINAAISTLSQGSIGIGFAIPINMVKRSIPDLVKKGKVVPPQLGFYTQDLTPQLARAMKLTASNGVLVADVAASGAAAKAGMARGDVILAVDGQSVSKSTDLKSMVYERKPGENIHFTILRKDKTLDLNVVGEDPVVTLGAFWHGIQVVENTKAVAQERGLAIAQGVVISRVAKNSSAYEAGLRPNHIILEVNDEPVRGLDGWKRIIDKYSENKEVVLRVVYDRNWTYLALRGE
jgi:serine protease Do